MVAVVAAEQALLADGPASAVLANAVHAVLAALLADGPVLAVLAEAVGLAHGAVVLDRAVFAGRFALDALVLDHAVLALVAVLASGHEKAVLAEP